jgi:hypothetical protein
VSYYDGYKSYRVDNVDTYDLTTSVDLVEVQVLDVRRGVVIAKH